MKTKDKVNLVGGCGRLLGIGLCISSISAYGAFFDDVGVVPVPVSINDEGAYVSTSATAPDGLFTYAVGLNQVHIFSRDPSTGLLDLTGVFNTASLSSGSDGASLLPY